MQLEMSIMFPVVIFETGEMNESFIQVAEMIVEVSRQIWTTLSVLCSGSQPWGWQPQAAMVCADAACSGSRLLLLGLLTPFPFVTWNPSCCCKADRPCFPGSDFEMLGRMQDCFSWEGSKERMNFKINAPFLWVYMCALQEFRHVLHATDFTVHVDAADFQLMSTLLFFLSQLIFSSRPCLIYNYHPL